MWDLYKRDQKVLSTTIMELLESTLKKFGSSFGFRERDTEDKEDKISCENL